MTTAKPTRNFATDKDSPFYVPPLLDFLGAWVQRFQSFFLGLGDLESNLLADELRAVTVTKPIFICGLARSGSTLLHQIVTSSPGVASHRIKDYPMVFTPYWWRRATANLKPKAPRERPHQDRIMITSESPDAVEEMLWMAFFPRCHDPAVSNVLTAAHRNPAFEVFYRAHLAKLLLAEKAKRYAAKANYHVARLAYLARLFPDARFVIPVRAPASHIASLQRQHAWFSRGQRQNPRAIAVMRRSGHFEFGRDRKPLNLGDAGQVRKILNAWAQGDEVRGWACYWAMVYGHIAGVLASDQGLRRAACIVRFEDLCAAPEQTLRTVLEHCQLDGARALAANVAPTISAPDYYRHSFSTAEVHAIREETALVADSWEYGPEGGIF